MTSIEATTRRISVAVADHQRTGRCNKSCSPLLGIGLCVLLVYPVTIRAGNDYFVDYLYIESGQGDSSGGHAAIRFADVVYHFQYIDGLLRSIRQNRKDFEYQYRFLANRAIHVSRIAVGNQTYRKLRDYFAMKHRLQNRQFQGLALIQEDIDLIGRLAEVHRHRDSARQLDYPIRGAALFSIPKDSPRSASSLSGSGLAGFRRRIDQTHGATFLADRRVQIERIITGLRETPWTKEQLHAVKDRFAVFPYSLSQRFADLLINLRALDVIQAGTSLAPRFRVDARVSEFALNIPQIEALGRYRDRLQQDLLRLVVSSRPDWGYPLLVGLARLTVLDESIRSARFVFLDTFHAHAEWIDADDIQRYHETFQQVFSEARYRFEREKARLLALPVMDEAGYSHLELLANRYSELHRGMVERKPMRIHSGDLAPLATAGVLVSVFPNIGPGRLQAESLRLKKIRVEYSKTLETRYRYDLLTHNCVSEIFRNIEAALLDPVEAAGSVESQSIARLGGYVNHSLWNSIPFVSSAQVRRNFKDVHAHVLLSYRARRLQEMYETGNPLIAYLRESNVLTSTVYPWNPDDGVFLFFTDDAILPRPIFGAINLVAGFGQMLAGGILWPVTGDEVFLAGMRGLLSSLPELSFFNIRKGSYRYQPYDYLTDYGIADD